MRDTQRRHTAQASWNGLGLAKCGDPEYSAPSPLIVLRESKTCRLPGMDWGWLRCGDPEYSAPSPLIVLRESKTCRLPGMDWGWLRCGDPEYSAPSPPYCAKGEQDTQASWNGPGLA